MNINNKEYKKIYFKEIEYLIKFSFFKKKRKMFESKEFDDLEEPTYIFILFIYFK